MAAKKMNYTTVRSQFQNKLNAYKTLCNQTSGGSAQYRPTPQQLNSVAKWVEKGAVIQNVSSTQLNRWASKPRTNWTVGTAKTTLTGKYGKNTIKAVCSSKTGGFIVATIPTRNGKNFKIS